VKQINYVPHCGGVQKLVAKDESHSCKEPHATRQRKIPIVLRIKNGLRNGWLMQNWKIGTAKEIHQTEDPKVYLIVLLGCVMFCIGSSVVSGFKITSLEEVLYRNLGKLCVDMLEHI
jgi:hypothetical protein